MQTLLFWKNKEATTIPLTKIKEQLDVQLVRSMQTKKIPSWQQLKLSRKFMSKKEKQLFLVSFTVLILALIGISIQIYRLNTVPVPARGGTYAEGLIGSPRFINPLLASSNDVDRDISALVFSGLMKYDSQGNIVTDLAESWELSEDKKTYAFTLREDLQWHDGERLTTDDVLYTYKTAQDPNYKSPLRVSISGVQINALDDQKIVFILSEPFPSFLSVMTTGIVPRHIWYSIPAANASLAEANIKPIGSGPYKFEKLQKDSSGTILNMTLRRNDDFYQRAPYIDAIIFKFYPDFPTAIEALKNKNVDGVSFLPLEYAEEIANQRNVTIKKLNLSQYTAIFFNPNNNEILRNKAIREALAISIDRQRIVNQALDNNGQIINSPILPGSIGYYPDHTIYSYDKTKAIKIFEDNGWVIPEEERFRKKDGEVLTFKITTVDHRENTIALSIIKENWEGIGIKTEIEIIPSENIRRNIIEQRNYQLLLFGQIIGQNQDPYAFWHSSQNQHPGNNLTVLANKDIDAALESLRQSTTLTLQTEAYKKFQDKLTSEVYAIWLYNPTYSYPLSKEIKGHQDIKSINVPSNRFASIADWYIKTSRGAK